MYHFFWDTRYNSEIRQHLTKICSIKKIIGKRDWFKELHSFKICFSKHFYIGKMGSCSNLCIIVMRHFSFGGSDFTTICAHE